MKAKNEPEKIQIIAVFIIILFLLLMMRLWQLQILQGTEYRELSEANRLKMVNVPPPRGIIFDRNGIPLVRNSAYYYAAIVPDEFDKSKIGLLSKVINVPAEEIQQQLEKADLGTCVPIRLKEGLSFDEIAYIEARRSDLPGLIIEAEVSREYIFGNVASHLIGYLGKLSPYQSKDPAFKGIPPDMFIGQLGVEKLFDSSLRGIPGKKVIEVNALGRELRMLQEIPPVKGQDIKLSIDIHLQEQAEKAFGERAGALVAMKPDTGEILGLISKPSFDPNLFTRGISSYEWTAITKDKKTPMLNRALQSQYPPGSTFKVVTALAGLGEGIITTDSMVTCRGGVQLGRRFFGCWQKRGHGVVALHKAIVESCDAFFYETGRRLGIDRIYKYAASLGLGRKTGIELGKEREGLIPNTRWKQENKKEQWYPGETLISAIGQGYVSVTPIQLALMTSAVANGGTLFKPTLLKGSPPLITGRLEASPEDLAILKKGLFGVVNEPSGTGWAAKSELISISGKTGTAQVVSLKKGLHNAEEFRDHAWFVAFAPDENPEIALAVLVEHGGHGGAAAAPIAKTAIEAYIKSQHSLDQHTSH